MEKTPIDIYDLSRIEIHHLEPVAEERHIKINLQGEHMMISGIHSVLEEMVYNLIENAIKYNKEDGTIDVTIKKKKHRCEFCVKDSGIGIPADQLDRIFVCVSVLCTGINSKETGRCENYITML